MFRLLLVFTIDPGAFFVFRLHWVYVLKKLLFLVSLFFRARIVVVESFAGCTYVREGLSVPGICQYDT